MAVPQALFPTDNSFDIPSLRLDMCANYFELPYVQWGSIARYREMRGTWGFYVDDVIFEPVWTKPDYIFKSLNSTCVEVNFSVTVDTPAALAVWNTYRKRWLSRYWQENGVKIIVDLGVDSKYAELNLLGVPKGWWAFSTRGYLKEPRWIREQYDRAKEIAEGSGKFLFVVYGGGKTLKEQFPDLARDVVWLCDLEEEIDGSGWSGWQVGKALTDMYGAGATLRVDPAKEYAPGKFSFDGA